MRRHKAYDSDDLREFLTSAGYVAHIKANPRRKELAEGGGEHPPNNNDDESSKRIHPARRWIVERTISWLVKRRSLRTRWAKKAENWAGAHSACLCPHLAQSSGFRIESKTKTLCDTTMRPK